MLLPELAPPLPPPPSQSANTAILVTYIFALSLFFLFSVCKHEVGAWGGGGGEQIPIAAKNLVLWAYFVPGALQFQDLVSGIPGGGSTLGLVSKVF
jgi:hypothetical protein